MSIEAKAICIVVPCYNEALRLDTGAFLAFLQENFDISVVFVNDGSSDDTLAVLEQLRGQLAAQVDVLDKKTNAGKAEAVRSGVLHALHKPGVAYVGYWDADLATPLGAVNQMSEVFARRPEIEVVIGSRVRLLGRRIERSGVRHYLGRVFATFASIVLDLPVYDTQCGAKLFRVTPDVSRIWQEPFQSRWIFDVELIARFLECHAVGSGRPGALIYEAPLDSWVEVPGSKLRMIDFARAVKDLYTIWQDRTTTADMLVRSSSNKRLEQPRGASLLPHDRTKHVGEEHEPLV